MITNSTLFHEQSHDSARKIELHLGKITNILNISAIYSFKNTSYERK